MRENEGKCLNFTCNKAKKNWSIFEDSSACKGCVVNDWLMSQRDICQKPYLKHERCISKKRRTELSKLLYAQVFSALGKDSERAAKKEMYIFNSAENITNYIFSVASEVFVKQIYISDVEGKIRISSNGYSIEYCSDKSFLDKELQPTMSALHTSKKRPGNIKAMTLTPIEAGWLGAFFAPF